MGAICRLKVTALLACALSAANGNVIRKAGRIRMPQITSKKQLGKPVNLKGRSGRSRKAGRADFMGRAQPSASLPRRLTFFAKPSALLLERRTSFFVGHNDVTSH